MEIHDRVNKIPPLGPLCTVFCLVLCAPDPRTQMKNRCHFVPHKTFWYPKIKFGLVTCSVVTMILHSVSCVPLNSHCFLHCLPSLLLGRSKWNRIPNRKESGRLWKKLLGAKINLVATSSGVYFIWTSLSVCFVPCIIAANIKSYWFSCFIRSVLFKCFFFLFPLLFEFFRSFLLSCFHICFILTYLFMSSFMSFP